MVIILTIQPGLVSRGRQESFMVSGSGRSHRPSFPQTQQGKKISLPGGGGHAKWQKQSKMRQEAKSQDEASDLEDREEGMILRDA